MPEKFIRMSILKQMFNFLLFSDRSVFIYEFFKLDDPVGLVFSGVSHWNLSSGGRNRLIFIYGKHNFLCNIFPAVAVLRLG
jgi:hypothetical protein